jgi:hypothetical protein
MAISSKAVVETAVLVRSTQNPDRVLSRERARLLEFTFLVIHHADPLHRSVNLRFRGVRLVPRPHGLRRERREPALETQ